MRYKILSSDSLNEDFYRYWGERGYKVGNYLSPITKNGEVIQTLYKQMVLPTKDREVRQQFDTNGYAIPLYGTNNVYVDKDTAWKVSDLMSIDEEYTVVKTKDGFYKVIPLPNVQSEKELIELAS